MKRWYPKDIIFSFKSSEKSLPEVRKYVESASIEAGFDRKISMAVQLAIEEACSNIIRHAYLLGEGDVKLIINLEKGRVVFSLIDQGRSFEFNRDESPDLNRYIETSRKGGLGLYLIRKVMDEVDYGQVNGENHLRMVKYIKRRKKKSKKTADKARGLLSFRTKFSMTAAVSFMLIIGGIFLFFNYRIVKDTKLELFNQTRNSLEGLAARLADKMMLHDELQLATLVKNASETFDYMDLLTVIDTSGIIWADAHNERLLLTRYEFPRGINYHKEFNYQSYTDELDHLMYMVVVPIEYLGVIRGNVISVVPDAALESIIKREQKDLAYISLSALIIAFLIIYLVTHYYIRPVRKLSDSVAQLGKEGVLDSQVQVDGHDEISEIARAFNEMTNRFREQQRTVLERERLKAEISTAMDIQQALLPKSFPDVPGYEIASIYKPTKNVSGDYFDFVKIDEKHLGVVVADVSGKGIPGSLLMTMLRTAIRLEARNQLSPAAVLEKVNSLVVEDVRKGMFITVFYIIIDIEKRTAEFVSAGHNPMILSRPADDDCFLFNPPGVPLGLKLPEGASFGDKVESGKLSLQVDDMLVIYTDGITESRNLSGDIYGEDRLIKFIRKNNSLHPREFIKKFETELNEFMGDHEQDDDITLVVIKEKTDADVIVFNKKKKLIDLVQSGKMDVKQACQQEGFSQEAFYRYYQKWRREGEGSLMVDTIDKRNDRGDMLSYNQSIEIRKLIIKEPELTPEKIWERVKASQNNENGLKFSAVNNELRRLHLDDEARRIKYSLRKNSKVIDDPGGILNGKSNLISVKSEDKILMRNKRLKELLKETKSLDDFMLPELFTVDILDRENVVDLLHRLKRLVNDSEITELSNKLIKKLNKLGAENLNKIDLSS